MALAGFYCCDETSHKAFPHHSGRELKWQDLEAGADAEGWRGAAVSNLALTACSTCLLSFSFPFVFRDRIFPYVALAVLELTL